MSLTVSDTSIVMFVMLLCMCCASPGRLSRSVVAAINKALEVCHSCARATSVTADSTSNIHNFMICKFERQYARPCAREIERTQCECHVHYGFVINMLTASCCVLHLTEESVDLSRQA